MELRLFLIFRMSTKVLLATLSIPITPERTDIARLLDMDGIIVEKHRRLATLLGLQSPPTRQSLINDMVCDLNNKLVWGFDPSPWIGFDYSCWLLLLTEFNFNFKFLICIC